MKRYILMTRAEITFYILQGVVFGIGIEKLINLYWEGAK